MAIQDKQIQLTVIFRRNELRLHASIDSTIHDLGEELRRLTGVAPHTMRLLTPKNRRTFSSSLFPFSDEHAAVTLEASGLTEDTVLRMMGSLPEELKGIVEQKEDGSIIGFSEEEERAKRRTAPNNAASWKLPQGSYTFSQFQTLKLPGIELDPPPDKALEIMHKLASDPGIVSIMNKHEWRVGMMTEMAPLGYVGISPKCVLGLNKNHGEEISLRLRTDDLKGFRKYESIKKTLLHELAHMIYSEHDADFFALDRQLNEESVALDWTKAKGHKWGGLKHYEENSSKGASVMHSNNSNSGYKVGGSAETFRPNARSAAAAAALHRMGTVSTKPEEDGKLDIVGASTNSDVSLIQSHDAPLKHLHHLDMDVGTGFVKNDTLKSNEARNVVVLESDPKENEEGQDVLPTSLINEEMMKDEPDPDENMDESPVLDFPSGVPSNVYEGSASNDMKTSSFTHDVGDLNWSGDLNLGVIQEPGEIVCRRLRQAIVCRRLRQAIAKLKEEASPSESSLALQTLFVILRNVIENPLEAKFKRLKKANPLFQSRIAKFKGALEVLHTVGFSERSSGVDGDDCLILERNDPGLLWLARSSLEICMA